jgi:hypothetical protein
MTTTEFNTRLINMEDRLERFALSLTSNREAAKAGLDFSAQRNSEAY